MNVGDIRRISRTSDKAGQPLRVLVCEEDGRIFRSIQAFEDEYKNKYAVLSEFEDAESENYNWRTPVAALDDKCPVYVQDANSASMLGVMLARGDDNEDSIASSETTCSIATFRTYKARACGVPKKEKTSLIVINVLQNVLFSLIGAIPLMFTPVRDGINAVLDAMSFDIIPFLPAFNDFLYIICAAALMLGLSVLTGVIGSSKDREKNDKEQRQGPIGEIFQLSVPVQALYFALTGIGEEMLFRFGICGGLMGLSIAFVGLDPVSAFVIAAIASSVLFSVAHSNTYNLPLLFVVFVYGMLLACVWALSGSIIVPIIVHALYDFVASVASRSKMMKDARKFFFGKRPNAMLTGRLSGKASENEYEIIF